MNESVWEHAQDSEWKTHWQKLGDRAEELSFEVQQRFLKGMNLTLETDLQDKKIVDIGGGPVSLLLKFNTNNSVVVDPLPISEFYLNNYKSKNIIFIQQKAEEFIEKFDEEKFDEVWMYNCLQHVFDPNKILTKLNKIGKVLRICEPCDTPINKCHPYTFKQEFYETFCEEHGTDISFFNQKYDYPYFGASLTLKD